MTNKEDSKTSPDPNGTVAPNLGALASNGHNDAAGDNSGTVVDEVFVGNDDTNADGAEVATIQGKQWKSMTEQPETGDTKKDCTSFI